MEASFHSGLGEENHVCLTQPERTGIQPRVRKEIHGVELNFLEPKNQSRLYCVKCLRMECCHRDESKTLRYLALFAAFTITSEIVN